MDKACLFEQWTFLQQYTPSSHSRQCTEHLAAGTIPYCVASQPLSDMAFSDCLAANTLLPPQLWALPCCIHDITHFCLTEIQLGGQTMPISWHKTLEGAAQENPDQSPTLMPCIPQIITDQRQFEMGIFYALLLPKYSVVCYLSI